MAKVSIKDVAQHAGVSVATVSHVINKTRNVSEETAAKVKASIKELNYHPNLVARSFKTGRKNVIAFVLPDIANSFYATLTQEIQNVLEKEGYQLLLVNTGEDIDKELQVLRRLENNMVDAIILCTTQPDYSPLKKVISGNIPYLFVDRRLDQCPYDSVTTRSYDALSLAIEKLIERGHKKIGMISGLDRLSTARDRYGAYADTMKKHGLPYEDLVLPGVVLWLESFTDPLTLVERGCTAIVCPNNVLTIDAFSRLANANIIPGKDVELVGFKESEVTQYELQFVDLVIRPAVALGRVAGEQILARLKDPEMPPRDIILQASYQPRTRGVAMITGA